jgi:arginyl-tRNA synthetase
MDSNVSKKTNSHNFFKIRFNQEKLGISVKNLLKQELLLILDLYQQKLNVTIEQKLVTNLLEAKIAISPGKSSLASWKNDSSHLAKVQFLPIIYACPLGLSLATNLQQSPKIIMGQLGYLLASKQDSPDSELPGKLLTEIVPHGWINFYLDAKFIADWLGGALFWSQSNVIDEQQSSNRAIYALDRTSPQLFPVQYIHARCCSLLRLAARENLITFAANLEQIKQPQSICWLDSRSNLWLTEVAEHNLLQQLLIVSDSWLENTHVRRWSKLALSLSQNTAIFLADCRFLGEVKQHYPQKAIARLGLIALVQFWLEKILVEKLRVAAPREL